MTTFTDKELIKEIKERISNVTWHSVKLMTFALS